MNRAKGNLSYSLSSGICDVSQITGRTGYVSAKAYDGTALSVHGGIKPFICSSIQVQLSTDIEALPNIMESTTIDPDAEGLEAVSRAGKKTGKENA
jgi:hypothetical protein